MVWQLRQPRGYDLNVWVLGYFASRKALLKYCKELIESDNPNLCDGPCDIMVIGRTVSADGRCSIDVGGSVTFVGEWLADGNTYRVTRAVPCLRSLGK